MWGREVRGAGRCASPRSPVRVSHPSAVPQSWFASSTRKLKDAEREDSLSESSHRCGGVFWRVGANPTAWPGSLEKQRFTASETLGC